MKRLLPALAALFLLLALPACAEPAGPEVRASGGYQYALLADGTAEILKYSADDPAGGLIIPDRLDGHPVSRIGNEAFSWRAGLVSVTVPGSVASIGDAAFFGCTGLVSVSLPAGLTSIGCEAFSYCSLTAVSLPDSVRRVGFSAFYGCAALASAVLPAGVTDIGADAFAECPALASVTVFRGSIADRYCASAGLNRVYAAAPGPGSFEESTFGDYTCRRLSDGTWEITGYTGSAADTLHVPSSFDGCTVSRIGGMAFFYCESLTAVSIPETVTSIGYSAFSGCGKLSSVHLPDSLRSIEYGAFSDCGALTSIHIPDSVTTLGHNPFRSCQNLSAVTVSPDHPALKTVDGVLFGKADDRLICYPCALPETNYTVPQGTAIIGSLAFYGCPNLVTVTVPKDVQSIGSEAFARCGSLAAAIIDSGSRAGTSDAGRGVNWIFVDAAAGNLSVCDSFVCALLDDGSAEIIKYFGDGTVTGLVVPAQLNGHPVARIGEKAFYNRTELSSVVIPRGVTSIGKSAFYHCTGMTSVVIPDTVVTVESGAFGVCSALSSVTVPGSVRSLGSQAFTWCTGLTSVTLEDGLASIGGLAFYHCEALSSVQIPGSVTVIEPFAFEYCSGLTSVVISAGVTTIEKNAFAGCSALSSVVIPASVTLIEKNVFSDCFRLASVTVPRGSYAEQYCADNCLRFVYAD